MSTYRSRCKESTAFDEYKHVVHHIGLISTVREGITMPNLRRRPVFLILAALVILTLILRYPLVDHERNQSDSYFIHSLAGDIVTHEQARWIINPLSYIGYYPLSYPSGMPFLLAECQILTGVSEESTVFLVGALIGILFGLAAFCFLRIFIDRTEYLLLGTFLAILSSRFIDTTYLVASARGLLAVLILLTVFVTIECSRKGNVKMLPISGLLVAACISVHHMAVFLILFAAAYIIVAIEQAHFNSTRRRYRLLRSAYYGGFVLGIIVIVYGTATYFKSITLSSLASTGLFSFEPEFLSVIVNALAIYTSQIGFIFPLAFLSIPCLMMRRSATSLNLYPLAVIVVFIPLVGLQIYVSLVIIPYVVVLGLTALRTMRVRARRKSMMAVLLAMLAVSSLLLPYILVDRWNDAVYTSGDTVTADDEAFNVANYCEYGYYGEKSISNGGAFNGIVGSVSGIVFIGSGIRAILTDDVTAEDVRDGLTPSEAEYPLSLYSWFEYNGDELPGYFQTGLVSGGIGYLCRGMSGGSVEFAEYLASHSRLVVYIDNDWQDSLLTSYGSSYSVFPSELSSSETTCEYDIIEGSAYFASYLVFESGRSSVYLAQLPIPDPD